MIILAGGLGTRLRPLTNTLAKVAVPIADKPCITWIQEYYKKNGIDIFNVNLHYKPETVIPHLDDKKTLFTYERNLRGTAGTVKGVCRYISDRRGIILVVNGDTISNPNISDMFVHHMNNNSKATFLFSDKSLAPQDKTDRCAGVMLFNVDYVLDTFPDEGMIDDVVKDPLKFYQNDLKWLDIGTPEKYELAQTVVHEIYA